MAIVVGEWDAYWKLVTRDVAAVHGVGYKRNIPCCVKVSALCVSMLDHQRVLRKLGTFLGYFLLLLLLFFYDKEISSAMM